MRANRVPAHQLPPSAPRRRPRYPSRVEPLEARRLLSAGFLDTRFDGDGRLVRADAGTGVAVVVQSDGKVVTAGSIDGPGGNDFFLARYNPDGSPDTSFGQAGQRYAPDIEPGFYAAVTDITPQIGRAHV